ncbi:MAG TPA: glycerophosphodiester phosphodiesterase family protein [Anaerolineaceae bacterium]|nr:glycerophosphodiester phosphodiesterase family protein [Anaerolineaceae bacterium]
MFPNTLPYPLVFAHRGASAHAPENTLSAFKLALAQGAPAMELDAKVTKDGQVIVMHDPSVDRTTNGHGLVKDLTLAELRELDAGSSFSPAYRGECVPTLEEVFAELGKKFFINVELTNYTTPNDGLVGKVVELVRRMDLAGYVMFSSFNPTNLARARQLLPGVPLGYLTLDKQAGSLLTSVLRLFTPHEALHPNLNDVNPQRVEKVHRSGRKMFVYTVNAPEDMRRILRDGVDGFFTDDPELGLRIVAEMK